MDVMNTMLDLKDGDLVVEKGTDNVPRKIYGIYEDNSDSRYVIFCNGEFCRTKEEFESKYERFSPVIDADNPVTTELFTNGFCLQPSVKRLLIINGIKFNITADFLKVLELLRYNRFVFYDSELEAAFIAAGLAEQNSRGSCDCTSLLIEMYEVIYKAADNLYRSKVELTWTPSRENIEKLPKELREYIEMLHANIR